MVALNPKTTCLLVIDMQNGFASDSGTHGRQGRNIEPVKKTIPAIKRAIEYCRKRSIPIIYTRQVHVPEFFQAKLHEIVPKNFAKLSASTGSFVCMKGTFDVEIVEDLKPIERDYVIDKNKSSAFYNTWLDFYLRYLKTRTLIVTGCSTGYCVAHTLYDAYARDYDSIIVEDAVGDSEAQVQSTLLDLFDKRLGRVIRLDDLIAELDKEFSKIEVPA